MGAGEALAGLLLLGLLTLGSVARLQSSPSIVVRDFRVSTTPQNGQYVLINGRPEGVFAAILAALGLGKNIRFEISRTAVQRVMERANWLYVDSVPICNISSSTYGIAKNALWLVLSIVLFLLGIPALFAAVFARGPAAEALLTLTLAGCAFLVATLCLVGYFLSKRYLLQIETGGGRLIGLRFKPSMIGQTEVAIENASQIVQIINILATKSGSQQGQ